MELITSPALRRLVDRAARDGEVLAVILFGSRARGDAGPGSDIDVCLVLAPDMSSRETAPSDNPREKAKPAEVVASAVNPRC